MITVTIEGPIAAGKTRIANSIFKYAEQNNMKCYFSEDITEAAIKKFKPDILVIEKVSK